MRIGVVLPPDRESGRTWGRAAPTRGGGGPRLTGTSSPTTTWSGRTPRVHQGWDGPYDVDPQFHEPLVLFGYLAACTSLELITGIVILPQRPTALVAKQAAEVDLLSGGRFRLGVGLGWNQVEYEALGRTSPAGAGGLEEQVELLRRCGPAVGDHGRHSSAVTGAGSPRCPSSGPFPSGSAAPRLGPSPGWAGWRTGGSPWSSPVRSSTGPGGRRCRAREAGRDPAHHRDGGPGRVAAATLEGRGQPGRVVGWGGSHPWRSRSTPWGPGLGHHRRPPRGTGRCGRGPRPPLDLTGPDPARPGCRAAPDPPS